MLMRKERTSKKMLQIKMEENDQEDQNQMDSENLKGCRNELITLFLPVENV